MSPPNPTANKTDAGNGSKAICRVIDASRSPSPDPSRSPIKMTEEIETDILQPSYLEILRIGMENLQRYSLPKNHAYLAAEIDHLHNLPSYYNERNIHRHFYYFCAEKNLYIERMRALDTEIEIDRLIEWYKPHWERIHDALLPHKGLLDDHRRSQWRD